MASCSAAASLRVCTAAWGCRALGRHGARLAEVGQVVEGLGHRWRPGPGEEELVWVAYLVHLWSHQGMIGARRLLCLGFCLRQGPTAVSATDPQAASSQTPLGPLGKGGVALCERRGRRDQCAWSRLTSAACLGRGRRWQRNTIFPCSLADSGKALVNTVLFLASHYM